MNNIKENITWKDIFNTNLYFYGHVSRAIEAASKAHYKYMIWNDWIVDVSSGELICTKQECLKLD